MGVTVMDFQISARSIKEGKTVILYDEAAFSGVKKIAGKVAADIGAVFGKAPVAAALEDFEFYYAGIA